MESKLHNRKPKLTLPEILAKLDAVYSEEELMKQYIQKSLLRLEQLKEDKEFLQNTYMYMSNRKQR